MNRRNFFSVVGGFLASCALPWGKAQAKPDYAREANDLLERLSAGRKVVRIPQPGDAYPVVVRYVRVQRMTSESSMGLMHLGKIGTMWGEHWVCMGENVQMDKRRGVVEAEIALEFRPDEDGCVLIAYPDDPSRNWTCDLYRDKRVGDWHELLTKEGWRQVPELCPNAAMIRYLYRNNLALRDGVAVTLGL